MASFKGLNEADRKKLNSLWNKIGKGKLNENVSEYNRLLKVLAGRRFMYGYPLPYTHVSKSNQSPSVVYKYFISPINANINAKKFTNREVQQLKPNQFSMLLFHKRQKLNPALIAEIRRELELEGSLKSRRVPTTPRTVGRTPMRSTLPLPPGPSLKYLSYSALKKQFGAKNNEEFNRMMKTLGPVLKVNMNQLKITENIEKARRNAQLKARQNTAARRIQSAWRRQATK